MNTSLDLELMGVVLRFWSKSVNSFLLPFGLVSLTLRDVSILTGLLIQGIDALSLLDTQDSSLPSFEVSSTTQTLYSTTIQKWDGVSEILTIVEHVEFLWVLLCRNVSCKPAMEYLPLAKSLTLSQPYALGTMLLALVYQAMSKYVFDKPY